jgi:hypothetical protein
MRLKILAGLWAIGAAALLAGCGSTGAVTTAPPPLKPGPITRATAVPEPLLAYSQAVRPLLDLTLKKGWALLGRMGREDNDTLSLDCLNTGQNLSDLFDNFHAAYAPDQSKKTASNANAGFKLVLSSIDECGMAVDTGSSWERTNASRDLYKGLSRISAADQSIKAWATSKH